VVRVRTSWVCGEEVEDFVGLEVGLNGRVVVVVIVVVVVDMAVRSLVVVQEACLIAIVEGNFEDLQVVVVRMVIVGW
jgi:hypothetical protein